MARNNFRGVRLSFDYFTVFQNRVFHWFVLDNYYQNRGKYTQLEDIGN